MTTIASIIPITEDAAVSSAESFLLPKMFPIPEEIDRHIFQKISSKADGIKITAITIIAYAPRIFFVISRQPFTVERASEIVPPTIGTAVPIINLVVLKKVLSPADDTNVPSPKIPENTVADMLNTQVAKLFTDFEISSVFTSEIEETIHIAI